MSLKYPNVSPQSVLTSILKECTSVSLYSTVFIPLLLDRLATEYAWSQKGDDRPEFCSHLFYDGTAVQVETS